MANYETLLPTPPDCQSLNGSNWSRRCGTPSPRIVYLRSPMNGYLR